MPETKFATSSLKSLARCLALGTALLAASAHPAGAPGQADASAPAALNLDDDRFDACEYEGFIALIAARNAIWFKDKRENLLTAPNVLDEGKAVINAVFDAVELRGSRDHAGLALQQFESCARKANLPIGTLPPGASQCMARQDIEFFAESDLTSGQPIDQSRSRIRKILAKAPPSFYPDATIDQVTSALYMSTDPDAGHLVRQALFETCLFPAAFEARRLRGSPQVERIIAVLGTSQVGPDVHTQPICGHPTEGHARADLHTDVVVVVARDSGSFGGDESLRHRADAAGEQFGQLLVKDYCSHDRTARLVIDASTGIDGKTKFAQQARMLRAETVVLVEAPVASASLGKPGIDINATAVSLDTHRDDPVVRGTYVRSWPAWREKGDVEVTAPADMASRFVLGAAESMR